MMVAVGMTFEYLEIRLLKSATTTGIKRDKLTISTLATTTHTKAKVRAAASSLLLYPIAMMISTYLIT